MKKTPAHEKEPVPSQSTEGTGIRGKLRRLLSVVGDTHRKHVRTLLALAVFLGVCVGVLLLLVTGEREDRVSLTPDDIQIVKISPRDQSAVVKTSGGTMHVIRVGDSPKGLGRVVEVVEGRIVIAAQGEGGNEEIMIKVEDGTQRVVRIRKVGDTEPLFSAGQPVND